jgi:hypothetical protein
MIPQPAHDRANAAILFALGASDTAEGTMREGDEGFTLSRIIYWLICGALIFGGLAMASTAHLLPWEAVQVIARDLGMASLIAGILAAFVDPHFRREFARDAFVAAFRRVLPNELKDEVEKIMRIDCITQKQTWTVQIERVPQTDLVLVTTSFERVIKNRSKLDKAVNLHYEAEDYRFSPGPTKIIECAIQGENQDKPHRFLSEVERAYGVEGKTPDITIKPDKTAKLWGKATQYRRQNDSMYETFRMPIINPEIRVIINDEEFCHDVRFGTYGDKTKAEFENHYTLSGVHFPGQHMVVRWWPKKSATTASHPQLPETVAADQGRS